MIRKESFSFLLDLAENNNRDWFQENKKRYDAAKANFETFIDELIAAISSFDSSIAHHKAKDCVFRIYRDVRFSADKSPYKTHFGAHISAAVKKSEIHTRAGYYIHIEPNGKSMLAGGAYLPQGDWLKAIRQEIDFNTQDFMDILAAPSFVKYFGDMEGEKLKKAPKDYPADHPHLELLKHKSFLATHKMEDDLVVSADFVAHCKDVFKALAPFDTFLNRSIG